MDFEERYKKLNDAQRAAVDAVDGPVMVIAGPGTGKTELLGMRAANIMKKTDVLPENILCLTFTDAGSIAMQKRLADIVGRDAYNISIFTFHAFGSHIMNRYREYFYSGAGFRPADDLSRHRIITEILDSLPYDNPLRSQMNGRYTAIKDIMAAISDLKRAGLTDGEFGQLLDAAQSTAESASKLLAPICAERVSKKTLDALTDVLPMIEKIVEETPITGASTLRDVLTSSIRHAIDEASAHEKTTPPLTAWKQEWMASSVDKTPVLKVQKRLPKLRALNLVYSLYLQIMQKAELIDYDDMIMQVVHAIEVYGDLRAELQEKYQYVMVDEFQDTNMAQMRILHNLLDNPVHEGKPNIMVVGDDDQAIYGFQGAEVSNILNFKQSYPEAKLVTLTENYRSVQPVLDGAREIITQGEDRLETRLPDISKLLKSNTINEKTNVEVQEFSTPHTERKWIASTIRALLDSKTKPSEIAVIARKHSDLVSLISYMVSEKIPISYDRRDNVLDDEVIDQLELVGKIVHAISVSEHDEANALLPELLAHPAWGINPADVWEISLTAHKKHEYWMETMKTYGTTKKLFSWLVNTAISSQHLPLERMIDILIGATSLNDTYTSPLKEYFFSDKARQENASDYVAHLQNLSAIRMRLREHVSDLTMPKLADFVHFIDDNRDADTTITSLRHIGEDAAAIRLLTAHASKGLEFDHVFIVNATDTVWGEKVRVKTPMIQFPPHLRLRANNNDYDERLRLFYVAMTRARHGLNISYADENDSSKEVLKAAFLHDSKLPHHENADDGSSAVEAAEHLWYAPLINVPSAPMHDLLAPVLATYKLSATHVNSFVDVTHGGPQRFLLNTLLRFPSAPSAAASFGTAIHATLQRAHDHMHSTGSHLPEEDVLHEFEKQLGRIVLTDDENKRYLQQGCDALRAFLKARYHDFTATQLAEFDFYHQDVHIEGVKLTGKLDVVEPNKETKDVKVIDYKTGGILASWDKGSEYQKIKAHKYRQQLLFYKLLVEHSRDLRNYTMREGVLQFVEPDDAGNIIDLTLADIDAQELDRFARLITIIWQHIQNLSFPDTSKYDDTVDGIRQFEEDLLTELI